MMRQAFGCRAQDTRQRDDCQRRGNEDNNVAPMQHLGQDDDGHEYQQDVKIFHSPLLTLMGLSCEKIRCGALRGTSTRSARGAIENVTGVVPARSPSSWIGIGSRVCISTEPLR